MPSQPLSTPRRWAVALCTGWPLRVIVLCALLAALVPIALRRLVDGDEGYLLMAARLVAEGHRPYVDFFCPQMPGLPYVFGAWFKLFARNWTMARDLSAIVAALTGLCVFELVLRTTQRRRWALLAVAAFIGHSFVFGWLTIAKTYGLTALFTTAGCLALSMRSTRGWLVGAGLCFALAMQVRLYAGVLVPLGAAVLVCSALREHGLSRKALAPLGWYGLGAFVGTLLVVPSLMADADAWWFGVVTFHGLREAGQTELFGQFDQKWQTALSLLPLKGFHDPAQVQFAAVLALALGARILWLGKGFRIIGLAWPCLFLVSLLPTPTHTQYFCVLVPLLVVDAAMLVARIPWRWTWVPATVAVALFISTGRSELQRYTTTGVDVPGVWTTDRVPRWQLRTLRKVARAIDEQNVAEGASWWPGYFVSTKTAIVRGLANDFGFRVAGALSPERKARYHVVSHADVAAMIGAHTPRLFVQGNWAATPPANLLPGAGFVQIAEVQNVRIWVHPDGDPRQP